MLTLSQINKWYYLPGGKRIKAVDCVSLTLDTGDFAVLVGANGAGKSTIFGIIAGLITADEGKITFNNEDITIIPPHKRARYLTLITQGRGGGLPRSMTVKEVINLALETYRASKWGTNKQEIIDRLEAIEPGLSQVSENQIWHLSGGEYQLVALVVAKILCELNENKNHILLVDEHVSQLAPAARDRVILATKKLVNEQHLVAILSTHSETVATSLGNRQIILEKGRIAYDFSGEKKLNNSTELRQLLCECAKL